MAQRGCVVCLHCGRVHSVVPEHIEHTALLLQGESAHREALRAWARANASDPWRRTLEKALHECAAAELARDD